MTGATVTTGAGLALERTQHDHTRAVLAARFASAAGFRMPEIGLADDRPGVGSEAATTETAELFAVAVSFKKTHSKLSLSSCGDSWADIGLQFEPWPWIDPWARGAPPRCKFASR